MIAPTRPPPSVRGGRVARLLVLNTCDSYAGAERLLDVAEAVIAMVDPIGAPACEGPGKAEHHPGPCAPPSVRHRAGTDERRLPESSETALGPSTPTSPQWPSRARGVRDLPAKLVAGRRSCRAVTHATRSSCQ